MRFFSLSYSLSAVYSTTSIIVIAENKKWVGSNHDNSDFIKAILKNNGFSQEEISAIGTFDFNKNGDFVAFVQFHDKPKDIGIQEDGKPGLSVQFYQPGKYILTLSNSAEVFDFLILKNSFAHEGFHVRQALGHDQTLGPSRIGFYSYDFWVSFKKGLEYDAYDFQLKHKSINGLNGENYPNYINQLKAKQSKYKK